MSLLSLPKELRLQIFSELLVDPEPIVFVANWGRRSRPLIRYKKDGLCPAILRLNKQTHSEASPLLYASNRFRFSDNLMSRFTKSAEIAAFFCENGFQASLIRYICITLSNLVYGDDQIRFEFQEEYAKNLEFIRDTCIGITTLELSIPPDCASNVLRDSPFTAEALNLLDIHFKAMLPPKDIIVSIQVYGEEDPDNDQMKKMRDRGWTVEVTEIPKPTWISIDDRVEFDNEEDCNAYNDEWYRLEWQREQEREAREDREEYYRRRDDPYWMNDSDLD
jgi:hypothetical protein